MEGCNGKPTIPQVFQGQSVLLTGGTGFVGKVLLEKLLRCCPGVDRVYLLVRSKKGDNLSKRLTELLNSPFFDRCRSERGNISWSCGAAEDAAEMGGRKGPLVVGVTGDVSEIGLGFSEADRAALESRVSVVFHVAATVKFNDPLRQSVLLNTRGTREMLALAERMPRLKAFVHVSTAYAHVSTVSGEVEEEFYTVPMEPEEMIKAAEDLNDADFQEIVEKQAKNYHNTYLCTKALGERIIEKDYKKLPVSIFRPGIVLSTHREPKPGWSEGFQGPSVCLVGVLTGMIGSLYCDGQVMPELVPVDHVANAMLSIVWATVVDATDKGLRDKNREVPIYNFVSSKVSQITWEKFRKISNEVCFKSPSEKIVLAPRTQFTRSRLLYNTGAYFRHSMAKMLDIVQGIQGKKSKMALTQQKIKNGIDTLHFFMNNGFLFSDVKLKALLERVSKEATEDRSEGHSEKGFAFDFDTTKIDWEEYICHYVENLKSRILRQDPSGAESASKRVQVFHLLQRSVQVAGTIISFASLYFLSTSVHGLYMNYDAIQSGEA